MSPSVWSLELLAQELSGSIYTLLGLEASKSQCGGNCVPASPDMEQELKQAADRDTTASGGMNDSFHLRNKNKLAITSADEN